MAEGQKESWWKSLPGLLTGATGLVAALSGLVAGLNQLGVFRREQPAPQVVSSTLPRDTTHSAAPVTGGSASSATPAATPATSPRASASGASQPVPAEGPRPAPRPAVVPDAPSAQVVLPPGTVLELAVPSRTCAPSDGAKRFTARLVTPVSVSGSTALPARTATMLRLRRDGSSPQVRLDSIVGARGAVPVSRAQVRHGPDAVTGVCLRANARLTVTLGDAVSLPR